MTAGSQVRGALRTISGAYRRVPVRWRLGGGSAALTFVILAGVAGVTDVLTDRHLSSAYDQQESGAVLQLAGQIQPSGPLDNVQCNQAFYYYGTDLGAQIRFFSRSGKLLCSNQIKTVNGAQAQVNDAPYYFRPRFKSGLTYVDNGYRVTT